MGDLVSMADFKRRSHTSGNVQVNDVLRKIDELMAEQARLMRTMPALATISLRENAVINSMKKREEADKLARSIGYEIYADETSRKGWRLQTRRK